MSKNRVKETSQYIDNLSFDDATGLRLTELAGPDGNGGIYSVGINSDGSLRTSLVPQALKTQVVGPVTYLAQAPAGTDQATAGWRAMKIDQTSGTVITWADGNANYDNVASDLTLLAYS